MNEPIESERQSHQPLSRDEVAEYFDGERDAR